MIPVQYIGHKARKTDNVAGTPTIWHGHGDVQPVPPEAWNKLKVFDTVWRLFTAPTLESAAAQPSAQPVQSVQPVQAQAPAPAAPAAPAAAAAQPVATTEAAQADAGGQAAQSEGQQPGASDPQHKYVLVLMADGKETPVVLDTMDLEALKAFNTQHKLGVDNRTKDVQRFRELLFAAATAEA